MFRVRTVLGPGRTIVKCKNGMQLVNTPDARSAFSTHAPEDTWDSAEHVDEEAYFKSLSVEERNKHNRVTHAMQRKALIGRLSKESKITHGDMYRILDWKISQDAKAAM